MNQEINIEDALLFSYKQSQKIVNAVIKGGYAQKWLESDIVSGSLTQSILYDIKNWLLIDEEINYEHKKLAINSAVDSIASYYEASQYNAQTIRSSEEADRVANCVMYIREKKIGEKIIAKAKSELKFIDFVMKDFKSDEDNNLNIDRLEGLDVNVNSVNNEDKYKNKYGI